MRFAAPRRLYPQSCPDRSRRNTGQTFAPVYVLAASQPSKAWVLTAARVSQLARERADQAHGSADRYQAQLCRL